MKYICIVLLTSFSVFSQEKSFNLILSIDGCLAPHRIESVSLRYIDNEHKKQIVKGHYMPGQLFLIEEDYNKIVKANLCEIEFNVETFEFLNNERINREFTVDLNSDFFQNTYFILYIFNTDKECNGNMFRPIDGKNYTYEYQSSSSVSRKLVTKKDRSNSCFCN